jgi:beta-galactosidase/beta-glucuronidase
LMRENEVLNDQTEFYWDAFGYPLAWDKTVTAWARRTLNVPALKPGRRYFLEFEGILRRSTLFINGREVTKHFEGTLPLEADITEFLLSGDNEIAVFMEDYTRAARDRTIEPSGNAFTLRYLAGRMAD